MAFALIVIRPNSYELFQIQRLFDAAQGADVDSWLVLTNRPISY